MEARTDEAATSGGFGDFAFAVVGEAHFWVVTFFPVPDPNQVIGVVFESHCWSQSDLIALDFHKGQRL